jgi:transposase
MHRLFLGLLPGGAPVKKSTEQYKALLTAVRPRDVVGKTRRRMAVEELADLARCDVKLKAMKGELKAAVEALGSHLMDIHGIGPAGAARILADVGDVARSPTATTSRPGPGPRRSTPPAASTPTTACPGRATGA